jgi:hypothetical protein
MFNDEFTRRLTCVFRPCHTQVVSRRLPTAAAWVRAQVRLCEICVGQSGTGTGFLRVLRCPLPILIPPTAPHSSSIIRGWCNRPVNGRRTKWTQSQPHSSPIIRGWYNRPVNGRRIKWTQSHPHSSPIIWGLYNRQVVAEVPSGLSLTHTHHLSSGAGTIGQ